MVKDRILRIVFQAIEELNSELAYDSLKNPSIETELYDGKGGLDSLSLVMLISAVEAEVNQAFETNVLLASEKAMSMRNSPYRSVGSLVDFIETELAAAAERAAA